MPTPITTNTLFYGDNLDILRAHLIGRVDLACPSISAWNALSQGWRGMGRTL